MDTTSTLTATEVIDRVQTARAVAHQASRRTAPARRPVGAAAPLPDDECPAGWEDDHGLDDHGAPPGRTGCTLVDEFAPASLAAALGITLDAGQAADRRRPRADLPTPPPAGPRRTRSRPGVASPRDLPRDPRPLGRSRRVRGPAHRATPVEDRPGRRRPARPGSPALLRPRPRHRRRGTRARPPRCLATAPRQPRHHRRRDDPGHPRRPALRPDRQPHRRRTRRSSATPTRSTSAEHERSGSSPTPSTPSTSCPAATQHRTAGAGAMNLYVHLDPDQPGAVSIEKLGAATTDLLNDWLTRYAAAGGKVIVRPVLDLDRRDRGRPARPTQRDARALPAARRLLRLPRLPHATPGAATSTTSPPTSPWPTADHPVRPTHSTWRRCAGPITGSRPSPPGTTNASTTAPTPGPHPPDTSTKSTRLSRRPPPKNLKPPPPRPAPAGDIGTPRTRSRWFRDARRRSLLNHRRP